MSCGYRPDNVTPQPLNILAASHTASLAEQFSRRVQNVVRDNSGVLGYGLKTEAVETWHTSVGSQYRSAGVGAGIAGFRADLGLIDDPVSKRQDADSETVRNATWNWYLSDFYTRLKPGAGQIIIQTRWHEDDLSGRLLASEPGQWRVIKLPAVAGEDDPLGRAPGEMLWSDDAYGYGKLLGEAREFYERNGGMRDWYSLYQQDPRPAEGSIFQVGNIGFAEEAPPGFAVRAWDLAATAQTGTGNPDWTVGIKMVRTREGKFVVTDRVRMRGGPEQVQEAIVSTAKMDGYKTAISIPQDPGQAGKSQVAYFTSKLAGYTVHSSTETGDKATRASPCASQCNVGNLSVVRAEWNASYIDELRGFPSAAKDDQVDATSRAFNYLTQTPAPIAPTASQINAMKAWGPRR